MIDERHRHRRDHREADRRPHFQPNEQREHERKIVNQMIATFGVLNCGCVRPSVCGASPFRASE